MPQIRKDMDGPEILKDEVRFAIKQMKRNKACGPDNIYAELLQATEEFRVDKITEIAYDMYNSGNIPEDLSKSIFIALPKKPGATGCELHRTISLMSVVIKFILGPISCDKISKRTRKFRKHKKGSQTRMCIITRFVQPL